MPRDHEEERPLFWMGDSLDAVRGFPDGVRRSVGFALGLAQGGAKHESAKPLKGFGGAGVLEIVEAEAGSAYRAVYTVRFREAVYVLHAFQKKSKRGIATPKAEIDLIKGRLRQAERHHQQWQSERKPGGR